jgi:hypothetical protein
VNTLSNFGLDSSSVDSHQIEANSRLLTDLFAWSLLILEQSSDLIVTKHALTIYHSLCRSCFFLNNNDDVTRTRLIAKFVSVLFCQQVSSATQSSIFTRDIKTDAAYTESLNRDSMCILQSNSMIRDPSVAKFILSKLSGFPVLSTLAVATVSSGSSGTVGGGSGAGQPYSVSSTDATGGATLLGCQLVNARLGAAMTSFLATTIPELISKMQNIFSRCEPNSSDTNTSPCIDIDSLSFGAYVRWSQQSSMIDNEQWTQERESAILLFLQNLQRTLAMALNVLSVFSSYVETLIHFFF